MAFARNAKRHVRYALIRAGLEATALARAGRFWPAAAGRGVVFTLHHVRPDDGGYAPNALLSITPEFLDQAIGVALGCGLTPVHLDELPALLADPSDRRRFCSFTLDDGYRDNAEHAAPVFRRHGVPYTIFITKGFVERSRTIWWETAERLTARASRIEIDLGAGLERLELAGDAARLAAYDRIVDMVATLDEDEAIARLDAAARAAGIEPMDIVRELVMDESELARLTRDPLARLGAHTLTHPNMRRIGDARLKREIVESAEAVQSYCGRWPRAFAYPYGFRAAVGDREVEAVADAGFAIAVTTQPAVLDGRVVSRPTATGRVSLNGYYQKPRYVEALISGVPFRFM